MTNLAHPTVLQQHFDELALYVTRETGAILPKGQHEIREAIVGQADPAAQPGEHEVRLVATARMEGRKDNKDYTIPDVKLRLRIARTSNE